MKIDLLRDPIFSVERHDGRIASISLSEVLAELSADTITDFPKLRPHQRQSWHALVVQMAALCLHRQRSTQLPPDPDTWREWLLAVTPMWPDGEPWHLITNAEAPAFLQPPLPGGLTKEFKAVATPDDLDILITSKNHDVKKSIVRAAEVEHWVYALVALQTQQGFLGAGNYGISRMNGGFSSRPAFGVSPGGGPGRRFVRDAMRLLAVRASILRDHPALKPADGIALLWTEPWNGTTAIAFDKLDPFYIEICRRIRFTKDADHLQCMTAGSKVARIEAKALSGLTGDPWTPLVADGKDWKALTAHERTLSYRNLVPLVLPRTNDGISVRRAPLQIVASDDAAENLRVIATVLVRGSGKTAGLHEREVPVTSRIRRFLVEQPTDEAAACAERRVQEVGRMARQVLYPAALAAYTGAPMAGERRRDDDTAKERANRIVRQLEDQVDEVFFLELSAELEVLDDERAMLVVQRRWLRSLADRARAILTVALPGVPGSAARKFRIQARAHDLFDLLLRKEFPQAQPAHASTTTP